LVVLGAAGCSGGSAGPAPGDEAASATTAPTDAETARAIEIVEAELLAVPRVDFRSDDEPGCVAEQVVTRIGLERLREVGLDVDAGTPPRLWQPELAEAEGDQVFAAYEHCIDFEQRDVDGFVEDDGLTEDEARCVSRAYRASGIPRIHGLEEPHGAPADLTPARRAAHEDLDVFLDAAKDACRDWIQE
jgi:hypothetical protein